VSLTISVLAFSGAVVALLQRVWPSIVWQGSEAGRAVYLTFDDGPDPVYTPQVLEVLRKRSAKATFFLVGEKAVAHRELVTRICAEGHEIANHSMTMSSTRGLTNQEFEADLLRTEAVLRDFPCYQRLFRPAGAFIWEGQREILDRLGYKCVLGSAYALDPYRPPAWAIAWATNLALRSGSIIVLHDSGGNRSGSVAALPSIVDSAYSKGLSFKPLSVLFHGAASKN